MSRLFNILNKSNRLLTLGLQRKELTELSNVKLFHSRVCSLAWPQFILQSCQPDNLKINFRQKHSKKKSNAGREEDEDADEDDETWEKDSSDKDSRMMKVKVNSLRTDLVLKAGLNIARNKIETFFYESKIRVNGHKIFKKSSQVHIGDELDIIRGISPMNPDFLLVSRVEILATRENSDGTITAQIRRTKAITVDNYEGENKFV